MADPLKHFMKAGDLYPRLRRKVAQDAEGVYQLVDVTDTTYDAVSLSNSTIACSMVNCLTGEVKIDGVAGAVEDEDGGIFYYPWAAGDTDTAAPYDVEFKLTLEGGEQFRLPREGYVKVLIGEALT